MIKYVCQWFIFLLLGSGLFAQEFGGNPFSTRWEQINTDTARIIFPKGLEPSAKRVASLVHHLAAANRLPLGSRLSKINMVLQNQPVVSNGYVGLGPFRSELYMTPPADNFDMGSLAWSDQLALHEYRHVQQYNNFYNGASKWMRWLFGEQGYALAVSAAIPDWFYEGDAVLQETALSPQGRGRMPYFLKAYPALWSDGKKYSWMKLRNGSLRDYVPNHYDLGYLLVNYGYEKYGADYWQKVTRDASAFKGSLYPMQKAVKRYSGTTFRNFVKDAFLYYKNIYQGDSLLLDHKPSKFNPVTNYFFAHQIAPDSLVYLKSSYKERPGFYLQDRHGEQLLRLRDISIDEQFSYRNGKIVYTAYESHPRWQWVSYSVIKMLDIASGTQKKLKSKTRYFSPDISEDGKRIIANSVSLRGVSSLVVLNTRDGAPLLELQNDSIAYFSTPKFVDDSTAVAAIRHSNGKSFIGLINLRSKQIVSLSPASYEVTGQVSIKGEKAYFTASQGLKDEIFSVDIKTRQLSIIKTPDATNYFAQVNWGKITWSSFTAGGYRLRQMNSKAALGEPVSPEKFAVGEAGIVSQKYLQNVLNEVPGNSFPSSKYHRLSHPFNFHSWRPNYDDPEFSFTVYGNNILNTVESQVYYLHNQNDKTNAVGGTLAYGGLFPILSLGTKYTFGRYRIEKNKLKQWNQWDNSAGLSIPLTWVSNRSFKFFNLGTNYAYRTDYNKGAFRDTFRTVKFSYLYHFISWSQQVQRARQDIFPRWGYNVNLQYRHAISFYNAWQVYGKATIFMPGLFPTHSIYFTTAFQENGAKDRPFSNRFPFARGYNSVDSAVAWGITANYHLPLWYPDWGFGNMLYLQRVRAGLFYDFTGLRGNNTDTRNYLQSVGAEFYFDTKWWNQYPLTLGFRGGYCLKPDLQSSKQRLFFEFILPVSLIPR